MRFALALTFMLGLTAAVQAAPDSSLPSNDRNFPDPIAQNGEVIFDNIGPNGGLGGTSPTSQLDTTYPFDAGVADDFVLPDSQEGKWLFTEIHWSGIHSRRGGDLRGFNIIIWPDAGGVPAGGGNGDTPDYSQALYIQKIDGLANETSNGVGPDTFDYFAEIAPKHLLPGVTYWLEIQAQLNIGDGRWWWQGTVGSTANTYRQGHPLLGLPFWGGVGDNDTAFIMVGKSVPEPSSLLLLGGGVVALLRRRPRM